jgi:hypothetical protein
MLIFFFLFIIFAVIQLFLVGFAVAIGFLLHWMIPDMAIGTGVLVGMISTIVTCYLFVQAMKTSDFPLFMAKHANSDEENEDEIDQELEEEEEEEEADAPSRKRRPRASRPIGQHWKTRNR